MLRHTLLFLILTCLLIPSDGQNLSFETVTDAAAKGLRYLVGESPNEAYPDKTQFVWIDYQPISTGGKRIYKTGFVVPPFGLGYERQLWKNLGIRAQASTHWWNEDRPLAQAGSFTYNELFRYRYWAFSAGATWHVPINSKWDPYAGIVLSYRFATGTCDCITETQNATRLNMLIGVRYLTSESAFLLAEIGKHGVGLFHVGGGFVF